MSVWKILVCSVVKDIITPEIDGNLLVLLGFENKTKRKKKQLLNMDEKSLKLASLVAKWRCLVRDFGVPKNNQQPNGSQTAVSLTCCFLVFSFFIFFPPFLKLHWGLKRGGTWYNLTWQLFTFYDDLKRDRAADDPYPVHYSWYIYTDPGTPHRRNVTVYNCINNANIDLEMNRGRRGKKKRKLRTDYFSSVVQQEKRLLFSFSKTKQKDFCSKTFYSSCGFPRLPTYH